MPNTTPPIVLVSCDLKQVDGYTVHTAMDTYVRSVATVGACIPLLLPALAGLSNVKEALSAASGVLLTGARSNVHPSRYGQTALERDEPFDPDRDGTTLPLIHETLELGMPLFAICRGHQELNVAFGGTIDGEIQQKDGRFDHRGGSFDTPVETRFRLNHTIEVTRGGQLSKILGTDRTLVNSVHRQAVGTLGDGLEVEATADDGTIEAIGVRSASSFALGVQWHPEHWAAKGPGIDEPSTRLFRAFGDAARAFRA
ncbi:MAG: gamma-glutamyl-gamma-aminobutyrate hydrolase family protein [Pseudomonadota bacterium]